MEKDSKTLLLISLGFLLFTASFSFAGNIDTQNNYQWAWNDNAGWLDYYSYLGGIQVNATSLRGDASSSVGILSHWCGDYSPLCSTSNYQVLKDGSGNLSGWAWNDNYGWFSFNCSNNGGCGTSNYKVYIDGNGYFNGWAWNDILGWVSYNCGDISGMCATSTYKVRTFGVSYPPPGPDGYSGYLESSTFDTQYTNGVSFNSLTWKVDPAYQASTTNCLSSGAAVKFRFASSNSSSGPWSFLGLDGATTTFYGPSTFNKPIAINKTFHNNYRYYRYQVFLKPSTDLSCTAFVTDIVVNYSP